MNQLARAIIASAGASAPAPFAYDDVAAQLVRINSLEGSLGFSGGTLTSVTDASAAAATLTVSGSPTYTATDSALNNAPSFTPVASGIITATGVNLADVAFIAAVVYMPAASAFLLSGTGGTRTLFRNGSNGRWQGGGVTFVVVEGASIAGRKRTLTATDGTNPVVWNGADVGPFGAAVSWSGTAGTIIGSSNTGSSPSRVAFFMACSAVPDSTTRASLEAKLLADFG